MPTRLLLTLLISVASVLSAAAQTGEWTIVSGLPEGKAFKSITSPAPSHFVAVGDFGRIVRSTDAGATWADISSGLPSESSSNLSDLSFGSPLTGTAIGPSGTIVHTTNGGGVWHLGYLGVEGYVSSVFFLDENFGVVTNPFLMKTRDGGRTWDREMFNLDAYILDLVLLDTSRFIAVGPAGFTGAGAIFRSVDGGRTWGSSSAEVLGMRQFYAVAFADQNHGIIVGSGGTTLRTEDGGANWVLLEAGVFADLLAVAMRDPMNGLAVGLEGIILRTTDGGMTWRQENSPTSVRLTGVSFDENGTAVIVGGEGNGIILRYQEEPSSVEPDRESEGLERLLLAPNPAADHVRIEWQAGAGEAQDIIVSDLLGKEVARFEVGTNAGSILWNVADLPSGIYSIQLGSGEHREVKRVVVRR